MLKREIEILNPNIIVCTNEEIYDFVLNLYPKNELKIHIINALRDVISGVVRGAIAFSDVEIISPKTK